MSENALAVLCDDRAIEAAARAIYELKPDDPWGGQPFPWMALHPKRRQNFIDRARAAAESFTATIRRMGA